VGNELSNYGERGEVWRKSLGGEVAVNLRPERVGGNSGGERASAGARLWSRGSRLVEDLKRERGGERKGSGIL